MKILSICIPTYNRAFFLDTLLTSLIEQIRISRYGDKIEVLVSDNCSTDNTPEILAKYRTSVRFWRNEENIGPDANFLKLFGEAKGQYLWLPGDDDTVRKDTLNYLISMIEIYQFDYLYLRTLGKSLGDWQNRGATEITNVELLRRVNIFTTFITSQVIQTRLIKPHIEAANKHLGSFMAHYVIFLEALHASSKCMISDECEVYPDKTENTGGYRFYKVWAEEVFDVLRLSSFGNDTKTFNIMRSRIFFKLLLPITYRLRFGRTNFSFKAESPSDALNKYYGTGLYKIILLAYLGLPRVILRPINLGTRVAMRLGLDLQNDIV